MYAQPGKKLLFMGGEIGQRREWDHNESLDWNLLEYDPHAGLHRWVADINRAYKDEAALHLDTEPAGFEWIDGADTDNSVISFIRKGPHPRETILILCNFTPVPRIHYRVGAPDGGFWREILNSDATDYWGSGMGNAGGVQADSIPSHGRPFSLDLTLPPLAITFFKHES